MRDERNEDKPPYSRVFVVCDKQLRQDDLRPLFEKYGEIESLHMPKDRNTGESKGIAYIKFTKTSSAAAAIDGLNMKHIQTNYKPLKVMVATTTKDNEKNDNENKYKRLFIKISKESTESDVRDHFSEFGKVDRVHFQKDRETNECRGFAYVHYKTFYEAAVAFEECDKKYKPVFATPKEELKRSRNNFEFNDLWHQPGDVYMNHGNPNTFMRDHRNDFENNHRRPNMRENNFDIHCRQPKLRSENMIMNESILPLIKSIPGDYDTVNVSCSPAVPQKPIEQLFNIIPGMIQFKFMGNSFPGSCTAVVKYDSKVAAAHAVAALNNYEFPSGQKIVVKPENTLNNVANSISQLVNSFKTIDSTSDLIQLADAMAQASTLLKAASGSTEGADDYCSVPLPAAKPRADPNTKVVQRCFIVFKPQPLPLSVLFDIFGRFGDLIDINVVPNKTYGFAKFASVNSAQAAINTLHGATVHGVQLKVLEAEELKKEPKDKMIIEGDDECEDRKRARFDEKMTE